MLSPVRIQQRKISQIAHSQVTLMPNLCLLLVIFEFLLIFLILGCFSFFVRYLLGRDDLCVRGNTFSSEKEAGVKD